MSWHVPTGFVGMLYYIELCIGWLCNRSSVYIYECCADEGIVCSSLVLRSLGKDDCEYY